MFYNFTTTTYAKWILAGEHAVLRGHGALVFPLKNYQLTLTYTHENNELTASSSGSSGEDMNVLFWSVLQKGQQLLGHSLNQLSGQFHLDCTIPIGVGMGASAALSVAMARWFSAQQLIPTESITAFARDLEDLFHGLSSGLDIAGVSTERGLYFQQSVSVPITQSWQPHWYLSSCGQLGLTSQCINQVKKLWDTHQHQAEKIDEKMHNAVITARSALVTKDTTSLDSLRQAIQAAAQCFMDWGLVSETLAQHMHTLSTQGALAVKPTGSGKGGFVVSLWENPPPPSDIEMIPL